MLYSNVRGLYLSWKDSGSNFFVRTQVYLSIYVRICTPHMSLVLYFIVCCIRLLYPCCQATCFCSSLSDLYELLVIVFHFFLFPFRLFNATFVSLLLVFIVSFLFLSFFLLFFWGILKCQQLPFTKVRDLKNEYVGASPMKYIY